MGNFHYDRKKKDTVVCLAGARSITTEKKKDTVVCLLGARFWRLRPEEKDTVICLTGCADVLFFVVAGNFDYDWKKKRYSCLSVGCAVLAITRRKKKIHYDRNKKKIQLSV